MSADNESDFSRKLAVAMKNVNLEARPVRLQRVIDRQAAEISRLEQVVITERSRLAYEQAAVSRLQSALEEAEKLFKRIEGEAKAGHAYAMQGQQPRLPSAEAIKFSSIVQIAGERKGTPTMVKP